MPVKKSQGGASAARKTYKALRPIRYGELVDGKPVETDYAPDETIDLTDDEAEQLAGLGVIDPKPVAAAAAPADPAKS